MTVTGTTQYAIRAVLYVAEHGVEAPVRVDDVAAALDVPRNYLSKTLHQLVGAGVLRSERGRRGGFQLAESPASLTLARVAAPFDDLKDRRCLLGRTSCGWKAPCSAHPRWEAVSAAMQQFFTHTTIGDLMDEIAHRPAMAPARDKDATPARGAPRRKASGTKRRTARRSTS